MEVRFGVVTDVIDPLKFVIKFKVSGYIEDAVAYPVVAKDEPNKDDPVLIYVIENKFGWSYMYEKIKLKDFIRHKLGNSEIDITEENIAIKTKEGNEVIIDANGSITIKSAKEINIESDTDVNINATGDINLKTNGEVELDAPSISLKGSYLPDMSTAGSKGGFSCIPNCLYLGAPHSCTRVIKGG